jgi:pimeloyl-ACP methyl ester carboxylesterase
LPDLPGPSGPLETLVTGSGAPTTIFAHGFAGSIAETRPFGSGVDGTRVFFHFRGHGASGAPGGPWSYAALELELSAVRRAYDARRGVGVSLGAGTLLAAAVLEPDAFERLVLILPAALDTPRAGRAVERVDAMAARAEAGDVEGLAGLLLSEQPEAVRDGRIVQMWARAQAARMTGTALTRVIREVPSLFPVVDRAELTAIRCPVLVLGHQDDEAHPAHLVDELVEALPRARGRVFTAGGVLWSHRADVREEIRAFLNEAHR